jgi:hypothetical protein
LMLNIMTYSPLIVIPTMMVPLMLVKFMLVLLNAKMNGELNTVQIMDMFIVNALSMFKFVMVLGTVLMSSISPKKS